MNNESSGTVSRLDTIRYPFKDLKLCSLGCWLGGGLDTDLGSYTGWLIFCDLHALQGYPLRRSRNLQMQQRTSAWQRWQKFIWKDGEEIFRS